MSASRWARRGSSGRVSRSQRVTWAPARCPRAPGVQGTETTSWTQSSSRARPRWVSSSRLVSSSSRVVRRAVLELARQHVEAADLVADHHEGDDGVGPGGHEGQHLLDAVLVGHLAVVELVPDLVGRLGARVRRGDDEDEEGRGPRPRARPRPRPRVRPRVCPGGPRARALATVPAWPPATVPGTGEELLSPGLASGLAVGAGLAVGTALRRLSARSLDASLTADPARRRGVLAAVRRPPAAVPGD